MLLAMVEESHSRPLPHASSPAAARAGALRSQEPAGAQNDRRALLYRKSKASIVGI